MIFPDRRPFPIIAYNRFFNVLGFGAKLNFDQLIKRARKNTKLNELGADFNDESLSRLISSINEEANLHPFGVLMIKEKLISQLENRLWAEHWFRKYPEILRQSLLPIILITGLQRSGTTKMQRVLSGLPDARALLSWEALYPAPLGEEHETIKRMSRTRRSERAVKWISPTFQSIHPIHTDQPEEDVLLLDVHFMSSSSEAIMHVPSYANWLSIQDHQSAYEYERKLLKLLQWQRGGKYWVIKSPHHLEYLHIINKIFSDLQIIWMHRPIEESIPSFLSMLYYSRSMFSADVDKKAIVDHWIQKLIVMLKTGLAFRAENPDIVKDVFFDEFLRSEKNVVEEIVSRIPFIVHPNMREEDVKERYVSKHKYSLKEWDMNSDELVRLFDFYHRTIFSTKNVKYRNE